MRATRLPTDVILLATIAVAACREEPTSPSAAPGAGPAAVSAAAALVFRQVSAGVEHACGVDTEGKAWCWGANGFGELGIPPAASPEECPSRPCSLRPVAVSAGLRFRHLAAGSNFTCGLTTGDEVFCWGRNDAGQLGTGSTAASNSTPVEVAGNRLYRQVRAGVGNVGCAIAASRDAYCWGSGRLGNGTNLSRTPVLVSGHLDWLQLSVGGNYVCGITTDNKAWCWGTNNLGQLGNGTTNGRGGPGRSAVGFAVAQIDAGSGHTCAVLVNGRAYCWGSGVGAGAGNGTGFRVEPTPVAGNRRWDNVSAGVTQGCGVTLAGRGLCWGQGSFGELGNGSTDNRLTPAAVSGTLEFRAISAGFAFTCGLTVGGEARCWGENSNGQLGDGSGMNRLRPVPVAGP